MRRFLTLCGSALTAATATLAAQEVEPAAAGGNDIARIVAQEEFWDLAADNEEEETVIFSDSWGAGHEEKRMPLDAAWAITTSLYSIESR